ncbi:MAG TPA: hypothetical protein VN643_06050 [Pyrinomonadaceae bacterium]|nr:hypothetical protein [Pyrinomonadaceae bacterium]
MKPNPEIGKRIYREGVLPSGKPLRAMMQAEVSVEGTRATCASCHRRSGFGSSEGAALVPPVIGSFLFGGRELQRNELFRRLFQEIQPNPLRARLRGTTRRPAYTEETFATALREGRDSLGRQLDPAMPRYNLTREDTRHLMAYLNSLETNPEPAVSSSVIHFATVITEGAAAEQRRAILDVMNAFVRWRNAETKGLIQRPGHAAFYDATSYSGLREWTFDVWELKGPPATWPRQLARYYQKQPVFALLGGVGLESWQPVHDFCERTEVPCLFPNTALPVSTAGAYSIYFTGGLTTEAAALALHLSEDRKESGARILQVYRDNDSRCMSGIGVPPMGHASRARRPCHIQVLAESLRRSLGNQVEVREREIRDGEKVSTAFWKKLIEQERPSMLVLWLDDTEIKTLEQVSLPGVKQIYLSASLVDPELSGFPQELRDKTFLTFPFSLPQSSAPHAFRARAWLRSRGIEKADERIQLNTYFMLGVVDHALTNLAGNFSRDYFIENVELETGLTPNPGVFPRLSLGPGQRFASKGSYIVSVANGKIEPISRWIVP